MMNFTVICLLDMYSITCGTAVSYFLPMMIIHKFVLFISVKARFHGLLFFDWET